jgi:hypothetical protein
MLDEDLPMLEDGNMFVADREVIITDRDGDEEQEEIEEDSYDDYDDNDKNIIENYG